MSYVLVVEDESPVRTLVCAYLRNAGHTVECVGSAEEAVQACASCPFDLVLSDIRMPEIDGHELARRLAEICPQTRVLLMSGFDPGCDACPYSPQCEIVSKPFSPERLVFCVSRSLAAPPPRVKGANS